MTEIKLNPNWVEFKQVQGNDIIDTCIDATDVAFFTYRSKYTTIVTLKDTDTGPQMIVAEPYEDVKAKLFNVLNKGE